MHNIHILIVLQMHICSQLNQFIHYLDIASVGCKMQWSKSLSGLLVDKLLHFNGVIQFLIHGSIVVCNYQSICHKINYMIIS